MSPSPGSPEQRARAQIDAALTAAGWTVQDRDQMNLSAGRGVAVREFRLAAGHGFADYLLFVDGQAVGVLEAKPEGHTLSGVEVQAEKYSTELPAGLNPPVAPLPFLCLSTGSITKFIAQIGVTQAESIRSLLVEGDLLVVEGNGSVDQIGRVALWKGAISPLMARAYRWAVNPREERPEQLALECGANLDPPADLGAD